MKIDRQDQEIIDEFKEMPLIKDHRDKDELFQSISSQLHVKENTANKKLQLVPILSGVLVIIMFMIVSPLIFKNIFPADKQGASEKSSLEDSVDSDKNIELARDHLKEDKDIEKKMTTKDVPSYVVQEIDSDSNVIYGAVADDQLQFVIPVTIIVPNTNELNMYYNKIENYLHESEWGTNDYLFKETIFDIDLAKKQVTMKFPKDFSIGEGTAGAYMFGEVLTTMFSPYQIDKIIFNGPVDLGPIGKVTEYPLSEVEKVNYKIYQLSDGQRKFLVPNKQDSETTIEEAISDMKVDEDLFNVYQTIPEDTEISLRSSTNQLFITLDQIEDFKDDESTIIMIEAILMTAKSFNYDIVTFTDSPIDVVGQYQLSKPITVPKAVNPIYILDESD